MAYISNPLKSEPVAPRAYARFFPSIAFDQSLYDYVRQRDAERNAILRQWTPQQLIKLQEMAATYPANSPATHVGLTKAGLSPDDPRTKGVMQADLRALAKSPFSWTSPGDWVDAGSRFLKRATQTAFDALAEPVRGLVSEPFSALQLASDRANRDPEGSGSFIGDTIASLREVPTAIGNLPQAYRDVNAPTLQQVRQLEGPESPYGQGLIPNFNLITPENTPEFRGLVAQGATPESARTWIETDRMRRANQGFVRNLFDPEDPFETPDGRKILPLGPGRLIASQVAEPGTVPYQVASGITDFATQLIADPSNLLLAGAGPFLKARKVFRPGVAPHAVDAIEKVVDVPGTVIAKADDAIDAEIIGEGAEVATTIGSRASPALPSGERGLVAVTEETAPRLSEAEQTIFEGFDQRAALGLDPDDIIDAEIVREKAGIVEGLRRFVHGPTFEQWSTTRAAQRAYQFFADTDDFATIWRVTGQKLPRYLVQDLVNAKNVDEVQQAIRPWVGLHVRSTSDVIRGGAGSRVLGGLVSGPTGRTFGLHVGADVAGINLPLVNLTLHPSTWRILGIMPERTLNPYNTDEALTTLDQAALNAKLDMETRNNLINELATAEGVGDTYKVAGDYVAAVAGKMKDRHVSEKLINEVLSQWDDHSRSFRHFFTGKTGEAVPHPLAPKTLVDGEEIAEPAAHLYSELAHAGVMLPDPKLIKDTVGLIKPMMTHLPDKAWKTLQVSRMGLDFAVNSLWKGMVLLRPALFSRVIGEELVRMSVAGFDSLFRHPASYMAYAMGKKGALDAFGHSLDDAAEFFGLRQHKGLSTYGGRLLDPAVFTGDWQVVGRNDPAYYRGWATEMSHLASDPVAKRVAGGLDPDELKKLHQQLGIPEGTLTGYDAVKAWFKRGNGAHYREQLSQGNKVRGRLLEDDVADEYIDSIMERIQIKTGGHKDLIDSIAHGRIGNYTLNSTDFDSKLVGQHLKASQYQDVAPEFVKAERYLRGHFGRGTELGRVYDRVVDSAFGWLLGKPSTRLNRIPVFKQSYWKGMTDQAKFMDDAVLNKAITAAEAAGEFDYAKEMTKWLGKGDGHIHSMKQADFASKAYAAASVKKLLYDASRRSQFADTLSIIAPFAEVWREMLTVWPGLVKNNPRILRRAQQTLQGGRNTGFFWTDENGDERFTWPMVQLATELLVGDSKSSADIRAMTSGKLSGLNLLTAGNPVLPSPGPLVGLLAGHTIPDIPTYDGLKDFLFPWGTPENLFQAYTPAWVRDAFTGIFGEGASNRNIVDAWNSSTIELAGVLAQTGDYDLSTPAGAEELIKDASRRNRVWWLVKALWRAVAPTGIDVDFEVKGPDDPATHRWLTLRAISEEVRAKEEEFGNDKEAMQWAMSRYGIDPLLLDPPNYEWTKKRAVSKEGTDWERNHPDQVRDHADVIGYFAPNPTGAFDPRAIRRLKDQGVVRQLSVKESLELMNHYRGQAAYRALKTEIDQETGGSPGKAGEAKLRAYKMALAEELNGYDPHGTGPAQRRLKPETLLLKVRKATEDPAMQDLQLTKDARFLLDMWDKGNAEAAQLGLQGFASSGRTAYLRRWFRAGAEARIHENPEIKPLYDDVFEALMRDDVEEE